MEESFNKSATPLPSIAPPLRQPLVVGDGTRTKLNQYSLDNSSDPEVQRLASDAAHQEKRGKKLGWIIVGLCVVIVILALAVFALSFAAASLAQPLQVRNNTLQIKGQDQPLGVTNFLFRREGFPDSHSTLTQDIPLMKSVQFSLRASNQIVRRVDGHSLERLDTNGSWEWEASLGGGARIRLRMFIR
jgi:hypothetical protein